MSNGRISTGLGDRLFTSYSVVALDPKSYLIELLGRNLINGPSLETSIIDSIRMLKKLV